MRTFGRGLGYLALAVLVSGGGLAMSVENMIPVGAMAPKPLFRDPVHEAAAYVRLISPSAKDPDKTCCILTQ